MPTQSACIPNSKKVVVACDSTKFSRCSLALIVPPPAIHTVITDTQISDADTEALKNARIEIIFA